MRLNKYRLANKIACTQTHKVELDDSIHMFVGLDVHKNCLQAAAVDSRGMLLKEERIPNDIHEIERFFADIRDAKIVIESSSAWYHIYELLSKRYKVVLSNPVKTKAIASAKVKTDRLDALTLANLLITIGKHKLRKCVFSLSLLPLLVTSWVLSQLSSSL